MLPAESVECLQACTVTLDPGSDLLGPSVGIVGVLVGGFIGFLGLRWQHRQSHRQFVLKEIARMTSALRDGYEIAGSLRSVVTDKQGIDAAIDKLKTLAAITGPVAATIGLVSPGPVADKAWHVDAMFKTLLMSAVSNRDRNASFDTQYWAETTEAVWKLMNELTELARLKYGAEMKRSAA